MYYHTLVIQVCRVWKDWFFSFHTYSQHQEFSQSPFFPHHRWKFFSSWNLCHMFALKSLSETRVHIIHRCAQSLSETCIHLVHRCVPSLLENGILGMGVPQVYQELVFSMCGCAQKVSQKPLFTLWMCVPQMCLKYIRNWCSFCGCMCPKSIRN